VNQRADLPAGAEQREPTGSRVVLVVGDASLLSLEPVLSQEATSSVTFASVDEVSADLVRSIAPDVVLSPLFAASFDCIELAQLLHAMNYRGTYRALSRKLPSPEMVRREIKAHCPGLSFDLILTRDEDAVSDLPPCEPRK
jgi:hypothetical protein